MTRTCIVALAIFVTVACSSSGPAGLGKQACPYLRPRLIRLDKGRTGLASTPAAAANVAAVDQDVHLYVGSNLPAHGQAKSDQPLVEFSRALDRFVATPSSGTATALDARENAVKKECGVS